MAFNLTNRQKQEIKAKIVTGSINSPIELTHHQRQELASYLGLTPLENYRAIFYGDEKNRLEIMKNKFGVKIIQEIQGLLDDMDQAVFKNTFLNFMTEIKMIPT